MDYFLYPFISCLEKTSEHLQLVSKYHLPDAWPPGSFQEVLQKMYRYFLEY